MKKLHHILIIAILLAASCNKDDDNPAKPATFYDDTEVMAVFAPSQLGDDGFADKILDEIQYFNRDDDSTGIVSQFIANDSERESFDAVSAWAQKPSSLFYGNNFNRRLLILTDQLMSKWLDKIPLRDSDEVLLLNTPEKLIEKLDSRYHVLNISLAKEAELYGNAIVNLTKMHNNNALVACEPLIYVFRLHQNREYPDSIEAGITKGLGGQGSMSILYLDELLDNETASNEALAKHRLNTLSYKFAEQYHRFSTEMHDVYYTGAIIDLGSFNRGFTYYLSQYITLSVGINSQTLFDAYINGAYDTALHNWIAEWRQKPIGVMPKATWHCGGSRYSSQNFSDHELFIIDMAIYN